MPLSPKELVEYDRRRQKVLAEFTALGRGSRQQASYELRIAFQTITNVLNQRIIDPRILSALEGWLEQAERPTWVAAGGPALRRSGSARPPGQPVSC